VTPAIEAQLNERQKRIYARVMAEGMVTRGWCVTEFGVANDTAGRDLKSLTEFGLLELVGKGRTVRYMAKTTDNRPRFFENRPMIIRSIGIAFINDSSIVGETHA